MRPGTQKVIELFADASAPSGLIRPAKREKRPPPFSMRFSDEERADLDHRRGVLSLAAYIRLELFSEDEVKSKQRKKLARKHYAPSAEMTMIAAMLGGLGKSRLASSMTQIAEASNSGSLPVTPELEEELFAACADIKAMRHDLITALGLKDQGSL